MNIKIRKSNERGFAEFEWLQSAHSFSFGGYYDPTNMGFGALRVINDDIIAGGGGFPPHGHRDMEIFTIPLSGALSHQDSTGTSSTITKGDVQIMSAGTGVTHSEFNASDSEPLTLLQIWITPNKSGLPPRYEERHFAWATEKNTLHKLITPTGENNSLKIFQNTYVSIGTWDIDEAISYHWNDKANNLYLFVIEGSVMSDMVALDKRDAAMITEGEALFLQTKETLTTVLFIEVPAF